MPKGRPPKPPERRQRRNGPRPLVPLPRLVEPPAAPRGLLKTSRDAWESFWTSDLAGIVKAETDLPALVRLWSLYDERERAYRGYRKARLVKGSQGQPVLNPLAKLMGHLDVELRNLEDRFGLTPRSRLALGIQTGELARSLDDLNRRMDDDIDDEPDPRIVEVAPDSRA